MSDAPDARAAQVLSPFERFNRAQGAGSMRDPYPLFAELRKQGGVAVIDPTALMGAPRDAMETASEGAPRVYSAVGFDAVSEILRDGERFSSRGYAMVMGPVMGHSILEMDEPEHARVRGLLQQAFTRKAIARWEQELVRPIVDELIDRFAGRGRADLVAELTFPFPVSVIAGMMGLPEEQHEAFHTRAIELISFTLDPEAGRRGSAGLRKLFEETLAKRRGEPRDDLISVLAQAELADGSRLDDEAIFAFLRLLAPAGAETTYRSSSNLIFGLLSHPDQLDALRADRGLIPQAIDEGLRWECPLTGIMRTATRDTEVAGVSIPADTPIHVNLGSANRDERRWEAPDRFDIFRPLKANIAFALGPHRCLGIHLASMETRVVLESLLDRFPRLRLDPEAEDVHITGMAFRSPLELPVRFD